MRSFLLVAFLSALLLTVSSAIFSAPAAPSLLYPPTDKLIPSPGNTTYYVDPTRGDDAHAGTDPGKPWRSIAKVNCLALAPGDKVIIAPGQHTESLKPSARGTTDNPVTIQFLPGTHEFNPDNALSRPWFISNSCDAPTLPKPVAILVENAQHLRIEGGGVRPDETRILLGGRMIYFINSHAEDITYARLAFDLKRPTVSEFRVLESEPGVNIIQVAEGSTYAFANGKFAWTGDLGAGGIMAQEADPTQGVCHRIGINWNPFDFAQSIEDLGGGKFRLTFKDKYRLPRGDQFQFRHTLRDSVAVHNTRSKDITLRDCEFHALTNMGIVSQFTENITCQRVVVAPPKNTIRTCPAWADVFQFSGCKGEILVESCVFSGVQDDPINVHGTHLRILKKLADNQLLLRFVNPQTYGFAAFAPGDRVAVIDHATLRELPDNPRRSVTACGPDPADPTGHQWIVTLDGPAPAFNENDVIDNLTWYPNFTARDNFVTMDSCRGFLVTTRGKVLIEGNTFNRCAMPGILIEDDANGWFESGPVRDVLIRNNSFIGCGITINPNCGKSNLPVHENIRIVDNFFDSASISAHHTQGLVITGSSSPLGSVPLDIHPTCTDIKLDNNQIKASKLNHSVSSGAGTQP